LGKRRGRLSSKELRLNLLELVQEASKGGARLEASCKLLGTTSRTIQRWKNSSALEDQRQLKTAAPHNKLSAEEVDNVLKVVNEEKYADLPPSKIVPLLADEGRYIASEATIYRLLKFARMLTHRHRSKPKSRFKPKAISAFGPNRLYSWDITYIASTVKGWFFYLYIIMDVYSRKIVGWQVYAEESSENAADLIEATCRSEGINRDQIILHSDNGSPMKGATMLTTLQRLGVVPSFSRPSVSNDNPYSESLFKTLKYSPWYPENPFENVVEAREWVANFVNWYNTEHLHSGIKFVTPNQRHQGLDKEILSHRDRVYQEAKKQRPNRWSKETRNWSEIKEVILNPEKFKTPSIGE